MYSTVVRSYCFQSWHIPSRLARQAFTLCAAGLSTSKPPAVRSCSRHVPGNPPGRQGCPPKTVDRWRSIRRPAGLVPLPESECGCARFGAAGEVPLARGHASASSPSATISATVSPTRRSRFSAAEAFEDHLRIGSKRAAKIALEPSDRVSVIAGITRKSDTFDFNYTVEVSHLQLKKGLLCKETPDPCDESPAIQIYRSDGNTFLSRTSNAHLSSSSASQKAEGYRHRSELPVSGGPWSLLPIALGRAGAGVVVN